jgi:hypothetical protein
VISSELEDPEGALSQLLQDNPDLAPQIVKGLKNTETETREVVDAIFDHVDNDSERLKHFFGEFVVWVRDHHGKVPLDENLTHTT